MGLNGFILVKSSEICGVPAKSLDFVGGVPLGRAASFGRPKGGKKPLRTCGSKNSLLPADLRPFITGAWASKGQPYPPRALRPSAVRRLIFSLLMRSAYRGGVGLTASVRNDRVPHHRRPPQQPLAQRKGRVQSGRQFSAPPGLPRAARQVHFAMPNSFHPVPRGP